MVFAVIVLKNVPATAVATSKSCFSAFKLKMLTRAYTKFSHQSPRARPTVMLFGNISLWHAAHE